MPGLDLKFWPLPPPPITVPSGGPLALPQRISIQRDKNKQFPGRWSLIFLSSLWQQLKDIWEEARHINVSLFIGMMLYCPRAHRTWASHDFIDSPSVVMHPLVNQERGARNGHSACMRKLTHSGLQPRLCLSQNSAGANSATNKTALQSDF